MSMALLCCSLFAAPETALPETPALHPAAYRDWLAGLPRAIQFRPGKTSFVLGLEGMSKLPIRLDAPGKRVTLLDAKGPGSLRHIWTYWGEGPGPHRFEFYVDGEETPSLSGSLDDIMRAAAAMDQPYVPRAATLVAHHSHNLYLPVPCAASLRVDFVAVEGTSMHFLQLDYREDDASMAGVRLVQEGEGKDMRLRYEGPVPAPAPPAQPAAATRAETFTGNGGFEIAGPATIRRLAFNAVRAGVRLRMYFDGAETPAVEADLADFMGPYRGTAFNNNACYLPMPFEEKARVELAGADAADEWRVEVDVDAETPLGEGWRYFHAKSHAEPDPTNGWAEFPLLHVRGAGHWIGMHLYNSGMDHGGGDFAMVDGGSGAPAFLHGINGEDYFSFALFGQGQNFPYSEAFANEVGRTRLHLENPYPFAESLHLSWGALRGLHPRAVNFWYQDAAEDTTAEGQAPEGLPWQVFGCVAAPLAEDQFNPDTSSAEALFAPLPTVESLDAGEGHEVSHRFGEEFTGVQEGWAQEAAVGALLDLTYVYRHTLDIGPHSHMGYYPRLMMASTTLHAPASQDAVLELSYDDPIQLMLNGAPVHEDLTLRAGFTTVRVPVQLGPGNNRLVVRMADTPNVNTCWAALAMRVLDGQGQDITLQLRP